MAALAAMLFVQAALALASCEPLQRARSHGSAMTLGNDDVPPCHEAAKSVHVCLVHCQSGDQTLDKPQVKVPPLVFSTPMLAVREWLEPHQAAAAGARLPLPVAGPPRRILFQSLLI